MQSQLTVAYWSRSPEKRQFWDWFHSFTCQGPKNALLKSSWPFLMVAKWLLWLQVTCPLSHKAESKKPARTAILLFYEEAFLPSSSLLSWKSESESEVAQSCPTLCVPQAPPSMGFSSFFSSFFSLNISRLTKEIWGGQLRVFAVA